MERLEEKQATLESGDYFLPPVDSCAFQFRLACFEVAEHGGPDSIKQEIENLHPLELGQIMDLDPEEWTDNDAIPAHGIGSSRERVRHVQAIIRAAQEEGYEYGE